jgi:hypothetical protein
MLELVVEGFNGLPEDASTNLHIVVTEVQQCVICELKQLLE